ncbi:hypothetical protein AOLI_G00097190 [Acnodon oligacanthus]
MHSGEMSLSGADLGEPEERLLTERLHLVHTNQSHAHAHVSPSNHLRNGKEPPVTAPRGSAHKSKPGVSTPGSLGGTSLLTDKTHDSIKLRTDESKRRGGRTDRQMGRWCVCGKGRQNGEYSSKGIDDKERTERRHLQLWVWCEFPVVMSLLIPTWWHSEEGAAPEPSGSVEGARTKG